MNSPSIDQIESKSVQSMYGEVVTFYHGLKLKAPVVSSENYLSLPQKRISEMASAAFLETQAEVLAQEVKALPKTRRRVRHKVSKTIKNLSSTITDDLPTHKESAKQLGRKQNKLGGRK